MSRIAGWILFVAAWPCDAKAADPLPIPTIPQSCAGRRETPVVPHGVADRVFGSLRARTGLLMASSTIGELSIPATESQGCASGVRPCGGSVVPGSPIKNWLCFRPSTAHALPWLRPQAYVGPISGQFPCTSTNGAPCADKSGCAATGAGNGKLLGGLGLGRGGCNGKGTGVPPADDSFGGYKFATPESPAIGGKGGAAMPSTSTSYKTQVAPTRVPAESTTPPSAKKPTVLDSLKRSFSKQ